MKRARFRKGKPRAWYMGARLKDGAFAQVYDRGEGRRDRFRLSLSVPDGPGGWAFVPVWETCGSRRAGVRRVLEAARGMGWL
jgi:hypothetical protein